MVVSYPVILSDPYQFEVMVLFKGQCPQTVHFMFNLQIINGGEYMQREDVVGSKNAERL